MSIVGVATEEIKAGDPVKTVSSGYVTLATTPSDKTGFFYNTWAEAGMLPHTVTPKHGAVLQWDDKGNRYFSKTLRVAGKKKTPKEFMGEIIDEYNSDVKDTLSDWNPLLLSGVLSKEEAHAIIEDFEIKYEEDTPNLHYSPWTGSLQESFDADKAEGIIEDKPDDLIPSDGDSVELGDYHPWSFAHAKTIPVPKLVFNPSALKLDCDKEVERRKFVPITATLDSVGDVPVEEEDPDDYDNYYD